MGEYDERTNPDCDLDDPDFCADKIQDILVKAAITHPHYNLKAFVNDIGLIRLSEAAKINQNNIRTICLPFDETARKLPKRFEVIGWGATTNSSAFPVLQRAILPQYDSKQCQEKFNKFKLNITSGQICAGGEGKKNLN